MNLVKSVSAAKVLLNAELTRVLPCVILEGEEAGLSTNLVHDLLHGDLLVLRAGNGSTVGVTALGPADLSDVLALGGSTGADLGGLLELLGSEVTSLLSGDGGGKVRVDLDGEDVDVVAESSAHRLPGTDGLSGGDGNVGWETAVTELLADIVDVGTEISSVAVAVEHALVTNNDHGDGVLGGVVLDVLELGVGVVGEGSLATSLEEDAVDDLQAILLALGNDVLEDAAVGAVRTDGGEAHLGDLLDVALDLITALALAVLSIGSVGNGPLVSVGHDATTGAVAAGRLGLVSSLGAAGSGLGSVGWGRSWLGSVNWGRSWLGGLLGWRRRVDLSWLAGSGLNWCVNHSRLAGGWHNDARQLDGSLGLLLLSARS